MTGRGAVAAVACVFGAGAMVFGFTQVPRANSSEFCGAVITEPLAPNSSNHLEPPSSGYASAAPTSGAHRDGNYPTGVLSSRVPKPAQVALLESGAVLIQYADTNPRDRRRLKDFARSHQGVTTFPNGGADATIVVTAWRHRMRCNGFDEDAIRDFVNDRLGKAPTH